MTPVYFVPDPFAPDTRVRLGYLDGGRFTGCLIPLSAWGQLTHEQQACVRLCLGALRLGDVDPRTISPQLVVG